MGRRLRTTITGLTTFTATVTVAATLVLGGSIGWATAVPASKADDVKTARQGVLVAGDFPSGWSGTRDEALPDAQAIKTASRIPSCKDYVTLRKSMLALPEARSLDYDDGAGTTIANSVKAFPSAAKVSAAMKLFSSSKNPDCLAKFSAKGLPSGQSVSVEPTKLSGLPPQSVAYTANIADQSDTVVQQIRTVIVPDGRYVSVYNIGVTTAQPPIDVIDAAAQSALTRLDHAVSG